MIEEAANGKANRRILVLGSAPHSRHIQAYTWEDVPQDLNVPDYDVVILNLVSLCEHPNTHKISSAGLPDRRQFLQHLLSKGSEVIAVGVPGIPVSDNAYRLRNTWWLPCTIDVRSETGETIERVDKDYSYYFEHVRTWSFYALRAWCDEEDYSEYDLSSISHSADQLKVRMLSIAETRFQKPIAFKLDFSAFSHAHPSARSMLGSGTVIWLPPTTEISPYEAINLILKERYGLCLETISPSWVEMYTLPAQLPIEKEIEHLRSEISERDKRLRDTMERLGSATRFRKLLYEQGEDGLEPVVRDTFRELGAEVEGPKRKGHEDGRFTEHSSWIVKSHGGSPPGVRSLFRS